MIIVELSNGIAAIYSDLKPRVFPMTKTIQPEPTTVAKISFKPLFGEYLPKTLEEASIKESRLDFTVVGVILSSEESNSKVLLRLNSGEENLYQIGDQLPGNAMIKRITPEGVLVSRNGMLESLSFPKNELIFEPPPNSLAMDQ